MDSSQLDENIRLINFTLDDSELITAKKIIENYVRKIRYFVDFEELKIEMKTHLKDKNKYFEINGLLIFDGNKAVAEAQGENVFALIDKVLAKILQETKHKIKAE